jgi:ribose transport system substrate-binding protein
MQKQEAAVSRLPALASLAKRQRHAPKALPAAQAVWFSAVHQGYYRESRERCVRKNKTSQLYLIPILSKALDILELLQAGSGSLTLEAIYKQTGFSKTTIYRVLKTLVHRGYLTQLGDGTYRHVSKQKKISFGFGSQSGKMPFSIAVENSLRAAAVEAGINLVVLDNKYDGRQAIANAKEFVKRGVDLVIEFQTDQAVAPIIADKIAGSDIPLIAVDIPHPHATFFGVDNFRCGMAAGEALAERVVEHWEGKVDWVLGLDLAQAGPTVQARVTGAFESLRARLPALEAARMSRVDVEGLREVSHNAVHAFLKEHPKHRRILVVAANDTSALGAIDAARSLRRQRQVMVVGQDAIEEMVGELQRAGSSAVATVSHMAERYGRNLIHLGLALLRGETVAPYNFAEHALITRANISDQA